MKERIQHGLATLVCLLGLVASGEPVRLAVVPVAPGINPTAEILTAALTGDGQVALVERSEIDRIMQEQALSAQNRNAVGLGQVLNADGLLLLELIPQGKLQVLSLRLVSVQTGVALWQGDFAWPLKDDSDWAALVVRQTKSVLPKLRVARTAALPLSILNLRSTTRSPEAHALEAGLTRLLQDRLMREPTVFVLERRKLELLFEENRLFTGGDEAFWNGGYLLDGVIDRDGYAPAQATVDVRLVPPNHASPIEIHVAGARTNLNALTADLAQKILAAVKHAGAVTTWQPAAEATNYLDEAKWALRWGLLREAQSASEASWALGLQNLEVAELRVKSWRETGADHAGYALNTENSVVGYGRWPDAAQFADLLRATTAYEDAWRRFVATEATVDPAWLKLGVTLLNDLTDSLRHYYFAPEARAGQEDQIHLAQQQALRLCALILAHPDYAKADPGRLIWMAKARGAAFWVETPAEGVAIYREMMERGIWPAVRKRFDNISWFQQESAIQTFTFPASVGEGFSLANPPLAGWKWAERRNWRQAWDHFIAETCAAKDPRVALEGRYLKCASAWSGDDFEAALRDVLDFAWEQREAIVAAGVEPEFFKDLKNVAGPTAPRIAALSENQAVRVKNELWKPFEQRMTPWIAKLEEKANLTAAKREREQRFMMAKVYFSEQKPFDYLLFQDWQNATWDEKEAGELLPLVKDYALRQTNMLLELNLARDGRRVTGSANPRSVASGFESKLNAIANPPPPQPKPPSMSHITNPSPSPNTAPRLRPGSRVQPSRGHAPRYNVTFTDPASIAATNFVQEPRFWEPRFENLDPAEIGDVSFSAPVFREGRLWMEAFVSTRGEINSGRRYICGINLDTFETEYLPIGGETKQLPLVNNGELQPRTFEVYEGTVYRITDGHVDSCPRSARTWTQLPCWAQAPARLSVVHDRLYLTTGDSILVLNSDGSTKVLANCRRKPALTALDQLGGFDAPPLFAGPGQSVRALLGNTIWSLPANRNDWEVLAKKPEGYSSDIFFDGGLLFTMLTPSAESCVFCLSSNQTRPELLLSQPRRRLMSPYAPARSMAGAASVKPKWQLPYGISIAGLPACTDGTHLWVFAGSISVQSVAGHPQLSPENGRQGLIFGSPDAEGPWSLAALRLGRPNTPLSQTLLPKVARMDGFGSTKLFSTPRHLVLLRYAFPGVWVISRDELNKAFAMATKPSVNPAVPSPGKPGSQNIPTSH